MRLCGGGLKRGITEVFSLYGKIRTKRGGHFGEIGYYFPRKDIQVYRVLAVVVVCDKKPAELIYRLDSILSYKETLVRQLKQGVFLWYLLDIPISTVSVMCSRYSRRNVVQYLRINNLVRPFKNLVGDNKIARLAAVDVSYLSEKEQEYVYKVIDKRYTKNTIRLPR